MALMPKRVKHRKSQRGRIKGKATRGNRVVFGDFGLQTVQGGWISAATIEAGRIAAQQYLRQKLGSENVLSAGTLQRPRRQVPLAAEKVGRDTFGIDLSMLCKIL